jgi:hypothetical protein
VEIFSLRDRDRVWSVLTESGRILLFSFLLLKRSVNVIRNSIVIIVIIVVVTDFIISCSKEILILMLSEIE